MIELAIADADLAAILRDESWEGRWNPLDYTNVAPLAAHTAQVLTEALRQRGLAIVPIPAHIAASSEGPDNETQGQL